jgi:hypothetical protein
VLPDPHLAIFSKDRKPLATLPVVIEGMVNDPDPVFFIPSVGLDGESLRYVAKGYVEFHDYTSRFG